MFDRRTTDKNVRKPAKTRRRQAQQMGKTSRKDARTTQVGRQAKTKKGKGDIVRGSRITLTILLIILAAATGFSVYSHQRFKALQRAELCLTDLYCSVDNQETPEGQIASDMHYRNLPLGGLAYDEARRVLEEQEEDLLAHLGSLKLKYASPDEKLADDDKGYIDLSAYDLGVRLDISGILREAEKESSKILGRNLALGQKLRIDETAFNSAFADIVSQVNQEGRDAKAIDFDFENAKFVFEDEQAGRRLEESKARAEIRKHLDKEDFNATIKLAVDHTPPGKTAEELSANLGLVASASTPIMSYSEARNTNVKLAADRIHGSIINPGESFSFNQTIGSMTEASGYVPAGIQDMYGNDSLGIGGGLCQPSTTLYIAAVRANLRIDVHNFHTQPINYAPLGTDCMVSDWSDFVFTNTTEYPYVITAYFDGATLAFNFYGPANPDNAKIDLYVELVEEIEPEKDPIEEQDDSLPVGTSEVKVPSRPARRVKVYKRYYGPSGEVLREELMFDHTYPAFEGVLRVNKPKDETKASGSDKQDPNNSAPTQPQYAPTAPPQEP